MCKGFIEVDMKTISFKTEEEYFSFVLKNKDKYQISRVFLNNEKYSVEIKKLKKVY